MGFFHYRVKTYIEVRIADSVPIDKALGFTALIKGLVYDKSNLKKLDKRLKSIKSIDEIQKAIDVIKADGFDAEIYDGRTAYEWTNELVELADSGLEGKDKEYLEDVRTFWSDIRS